MDRAGRTKYFYFAFKDTAGLGKAGLTVTYNIVRKSDGSLIVNAGTAAAVDATYLPGLYVGSCVTGAGVDSDYLAYAYTSDSTVAEKGTFALQEIGYPWIENAGGALNPTTAGRTLLVDASGQVTVGAIAAGIIAAASFAANALNAVWDRLLSSITSNDGTAGGLLKYALDVVMSSRAAASTALDNTVWTNAKAVFLDSPISGIAATVWSYLKSSATTANSIGKAIVDWLTTLGTDNKVILSNNAQTGVTIPAVTTVGTVNALATDSVNASALAASAISELIAALMATPVAGSDTVLDALVNALHALAPTVPGNTLDVSGTGAARIDFEDAENQDEVLNLNQTTIKHVLDGIAVTIGQTPSQLAALVRPNDLTIYADSVFRARIYVLGGISNTRTDFLFTLKTKPDRDASAPDSKAILQISENDDLLYLMAEEASDPTWGTLVVGSNSSGDYFDLYWSAQAAALLDRADAVWDGKEIHSAPDEALVKVGGSATISLSVTRSLGN